MGSALTQWVNVLTALKLSLHKAFPVKQSGQLRNLGLMARYDHLPIFADAYRLALLVEQLVAGFSSRARPALGADLRSQVRLIVRMIIRANSVPVADRKPMLAQLRWAAEEFLVLLRLAKDTKALPSLKAYEQCANLVYSVSRQTEGWLRSSVKQGPDTGIDAEDSPG